MSAERHPADPGAVTAPAPAPAELRPHDEDAEELIMHLERDQLVAETFRPVPRAPLTRRMLLGLWALRIFAALVSVMVIYTFVANLG